MSKSEVSAIIPEFPNYVVTSFGRVINRQTGKEMRQTHVTGGDLSVGLTKNYTQYRRSVKVLVAKAFVDNPFPPGVRDLDDRAVWDTPVILDGDDFHLHADNLMWRPRWFAIAYTKQIDDPMEAYFSGPIVEEPSGVEYRTIIEAAMEVGSLPTDIALSVTNRDPHPTVFPHKYRYRLL